jgi:hypothetical protein
VTLPVPSFGASTGAINGTDAQLIWELVAQISDPKDVLRRYNLDAAGLRSKMKDKMFRAAFREAKSLWESDLNAEDRIRVKARAMAEDGLVVFFKLMKSEDSVAQVKLEAFEKLIKVGELGPKKDKDSGGGKPFSVVINLRNTDKKVVIDGHAIEDQSDEPV